MEDNDSYILSIFNNVFEYTLKFFTFMWAYSEYCIDNNMV